jgi:hypothetical protein
MTTPNDPLVGLPTATKPRVKKPAPVVSVPVASAPVSISAVRSARKRARLTGEAYQNAKAFARKASTYDETSPIWGKQLPAVLMEIEKLLDNVAMGVSLDPTADINSALELNRELQKRVGFRALMKAQRS